MAVASLLSKLSVFIALYVCSAFAQNPNSPCYDSSGRPRRCEPVFSNIAFGLPIEATNTCGEEVANDATGRPYYPSKIDSFRTFYRQTGASGATKYRDYCDMNSADPSKRHPPQNMVDLDSSSSNRTWWQSITLYEYKERNLGDMVKATITLHLGKAFEITYIRLRFQSSRPESFAIYKKTSETSNWEPYQYYSASCRSTYNLPQDGFMDVPNRAICTGEYSDISPLTGGNVAFGTLDKRPRAFEFDSNKILQEFVTATTLKIELTRLNTFGDEVFEDTSVLQSYYYALSDISVGGKCKCNGHANQCVRSTTVQGESSVVCLCQHNTTGADCGQCPRTHNDRPWAPATIRDPNPCRECDCNGRTDLCYFNQTLYNMTGSGGYCQGCRDFTDGAHCELCQVNYYRRDPRDVCTYCNCDSTGSVNQQCDNNGQCVCKPGVTGAKCDRCKANYYDFGTYGCRDCDCKEEGSYENLPYCDSGSGQCSCKENVEGQDCSVCKPGYFNLDIDNKFGCTACFCNGKTSECESAQGYVRAYINSFFDTGNEGWTVGDRYSTETSSAFNGITEDLAINSFGRDGELYFYAPSRFLGDQQFSYDQFLEFSLRIGDSNARPLQDDVILEGHGQSVRIPIIAQGNTIPGIRSQTYKFRLNENQVYQWSPSLTAVDFQRLLSNLTAIKIRGNYNRPGSGFLDNVRLYTAHKGTGLTELGSIERCDCPSKYVGQHCESCAPGFRRKIPYGGPSSDCESCQCNGHSDTCDAESGMCICQHETTGHNCEKCKEGWYGNARAGTPTDCKACPCPNQGACFEQLDKTVSCLNCPVGYSGDLCDVCQDGFYADTKSGENCTNCDCSGNVDSNAVGNCNSTSGVCLKCIYNTGGDQCEKCLSGFYGNATADEKEDCKPCDCNKYGTNATMLDVCEEHKGNCSCLPHVTGRQCDQCAEGYYDLESTGGCRACLCDPEGSYSTSCDLYTGQCSCKPGVGGLRCDICIADYYGFSREGCEPCNCLEVGSAHQQCDNSGQCVCKDDTRITGQLCDRCQENKYNLTAGCLDCPACYNLVQDSVGDIRAGLDDLAETLKNINENPNVADDSEFTDQLNDLSMDIDDMLKQAEELKRSGGSVPQDIQDIEADLRELQKTLSAIMESFDKSDMKYNSIDISSLDERIRTVSDEVAAARERFTKESTDLYTKIESALGKNGPKSRSQNMTSMAQNSTVILAKQEKDSEEIIQTADSANEISNNAYSLALEVVEKPDSLADMLVELDKRIDEGRQNLAKVNATAEQALEKASQVYADALEALTDVTNIAVPPADTELAVREAQAILEEALAHKLQTDTLLSNYSLLLNDTRDTLYQAELTYNKTYLEQQVTDRLLAEVDVALQKAQDAINAPAEMLRIGREQLKLLQEFDQKVKDLKELALEALKKIPQIEEILEKANNETQKAQDAVEGANQAAREAKKTALDAEITAKEASANAASISMDAQKVKEAADAESAVTDRHERNITDMQAFIEQRKPIEEAESVLVQAVLDEADNARSIASKSAKSLEEALKKIDTIVDSLDQLPVLNTTELDRLEREMGRTEAEYALADIDEQVLELKAMSGILRTLAIQHTNSLSQLRDDVDNIQLIVNTIPNNETCFSQPVLEPKSPTDKKKKRRRQRKLKKRLRH